MEDINKIVPFDDNEDQAISHAKERQRHFLTYDDENDKKLDESLVDNYEKAFKVADKFEYSVMYEGIAIAIEYKDKGEKLKTERDKDIEEFLEFAKTITNETLNEAFKLKPIIYYYSGVLYPPSLLYLYESIKYGIFIPYLEEKCNKILTQFITKLKGLTLYAYRDRLIKSLTDIAKYLGNARALLATFNKEGSHTDIIHMNFKKDFAINLGLTESVTKEEVHELLTKASKIASSEEQILGRLLYIMIWYSINDYQEDQKLLL